MRWIALFGLFLIALPLVAQSNTGELRLKVTDPSGLAVKATVKLTNEGAGFDRVLASDDSGQLTVRKLTFGLYTLRVERDGFVAEERRVEIRSEFPQEIGVKLSIATTSTSIEVTAENTILNPDQAGSSNHIDQREISDRVASLPGRSLQDLVNEQPGWLYEGNAVLHPRGSEYQTQFVVDGIPLTDNRSPSFGPEIEADDVDSINIYTAGIPAEYGRKMGGVVEVNTLREVTRTARAMVLSGGSFDTAGAFARLQYGWGQNTLGISSSGAATAHYLNPVVPENYTNAAPRAIFPSAIERDFTPKDHLDALAAPRTLALRNSE